MSIDAILVDRDTGDKVHTAPAQITPERGPTLITNTEWRVNGTFASATRTSAGTSIIAQPKAGGSLILTDLILTSDKVNLATVTVQFTDGTNTIVIIGATVTDAPANFAIPFQGNWFGWKDARVELVTTNAVDATVAIGYAKIDTGKTFAVWDAER